MSSGHARTIRPLHTSRLNSSPSASRELIDLGGLARLADRHDPLGRRAALTAPTMVSDAMTVVIAGRGHGVPDGAELAAGRHAAYVRYRGRRACARAHPTSGIRQPVLDRDLADRIYQTHITN